MRYMNDIFIDKKKGSGELNVTVGSAQGAMTLPYSISLVDTLPHTAVVNFDSADLKNLILSADSHGVSREQIREAIDKAVRDLGADVLDERSNNLLK